jgi:hypothetical protein
MKFSSARILAIGDQLVRHHPRLRWVRKWGVSIVSVLMGLITLFIFRRGIEYFQLFMGYLLFLWLAGVLFGETRKAIAERGPRVVWFLVDYTVQTLLHGLILFLLPIYYASTTLTSVNVGFFLILVAAVILTAVDPWYRAVSERFRWLEMALFGLGLFASLNVAFPLVGVGSAWALPLSGVGAALALTPAFRLRQGSSWKRAAGGAGVAAVVLATSLWWVREWIPPTPLSLAQVTFARGVDQLEPVEPVKRLSVEELRRWGRLVAFAAITSPSGVNEPIHHVWRKDGRIVATMPMLRIRGGRPGGFRTYSWKTDFGSDPAGLWSVEVRTSDDRLVGRVRLRVSAP